MSLFLATDSNVVSFEANTFYTAWQNFLNAPETSPDPVTALADQLRGKKGIATVMVLTEKGKVRYKSQLNHAQIPDYFENGILSTREAVLNQQVFGMALETAGWRRLTTFPSRNERGLKEVHCYVKD